MTGDQIIIKRIGALYRADLYRPGQGVIRQTKGLTVDQVLRELGLEADQAKVIKREGTNAKV